MTSLWHHWGSWPWPLYTSLTQTHCPSSDSFHKLTYRKKTTCVQLWITICCVSSNKKECNKMKLHIFTINFVIILQIFLLMRDWSKRIMWLNMPRLKLENIWVISPNFQNCMCCKKNIWSSSKLTVHALRKLFENCLLLGTDNVHWQICKHNFMPNGGYCLHLHIHQDLPGFDIFKQMQLP